MNTMTIDTRCPFCGQTDHIEVDREDWEDWRSGTLIQDAFKDLNASEREAILTGICDSCWSHIGEN